jgi:peroxiredoxin
MRSDDLYALPGDLPVPKDDGACDHLPGLALPAMALAATAGGTEDLSRRPGVTVISCYPRTGLPDQPPLVEDWNLIPGARGCTPQSCAFRDHHGELAALGAEVFGLSTQSTDYQRELVARLHLPFAVLSDENLGFTRALRLPTFTAGGLELIKRLTLIARHGMIEKVFYPVFPPDGNAEQVVAWLRENP